MKLEYRGRWIRLVLEIFPPPKRAARLMRRRADAEARRRLLGAVIHRIGETTV
jgi:hypothetical protein